MFLTRAAGSRNNYNPRIGNSHRNKDRCSRLGNQHNRNSHNRNLQKRQDTTIQYYIGIFQYFLDWIMTISL